MQDGFHVFLLQELGEHLRVREVPLEETSPLHRPAMPGADSVTLGNSPQALVLGFAIGTPATLPGIDGPKHRLRKGYLPIVESAWDVGPLRLAQTAFATLPGDEDVVTGTETQYVVIRMAVTNTGETPTKASLRLLLGLAAGSQNVNYAPFGAGVALAAVLIEVGSPRERTIAGRPSASCLSSQRPGYGSP